MKRTQIFIALLLFSIAGVYGQNIVNFSGIVRDAQTGNLLEGINVFVVERNTGTITNIAGEFFVFLSGGIYNVSFSSDGYLTEKMSLDLREDKFSEIFLVPSDNTRKKNDLLLKRKSHFPDEVMIEQQKLKTGKNI
jgi:hypothetical protein